MSIPARVLALPIRCWRLVSRILAPRCRFSPSCSQYALDALAAHGAWRGTGLAIRRVSRCHPWNPGGLDPVPNVRSGDGSGVVEGSESISKAGAS
jgi:putative membrane protein insertion efficiency factor